MLSMAKPFAIVYFSSCSTQQMEQYSLSLDFNINLARLIKMMKKKVLMNQLLIILTEKLILVHRIFEE